MLMMTFGIGTYAALIAYFARRLVLARQQREEDATNKKATIEAEEVTRYQQEMEKSIWELRDEIRSLQQQLSSQSHGRK